MNYLSNLFVIVAASGTGKSTLVKSLVNENPDLHLSISYTSRLPRYGECNGNEYFFVSTIEFLERYNAGEFLEIAQVHGNYYGTSRVWLNKQIQHGNDVILEIDWQGAHQIRKQFSNTVEIFILPPSLVTLKDRLINRGKDDLCIIKQRLLAAKNEISHAVEADYIIINQNFKHALLELQCIITATKLRVISQYKRNLSLFMEFGIHSNLF